MADGEADWENEDFEPAVFKKPILHTDRWEGEDEDDDVKDNWDDEEEEKEEKPEQNIVAVQAKKKKPLAQIIAEKEEKRKKELEEKMKSLEIDKKDLTPQERLAQKLKQQKLQEEADLQLAKETFGVTDTVEGIDSMVPSSREEFDNFRKLLVEKILKSENSPHFVTFLEELFRDLCLNVNHDDIKKFTSTLNALAFEKQKVLKAKAGKKKSSKKAALNLGRDGVEDYSIIDYGDEFDCL
ncbi:eukaryotic translation initiation factor 3 subunit J-like [Uloborus diversus]|uniref:eukaryotic translation initiation factor 3 subunit J-like n=1 Tax=Uloborus diversus TaxID=327109 RepID=UPI002409DEB2|nr:eukaryotic translation initiation factor 3 subunit J-like [Uloborus diversus]